ncbi:Splicing factor U2AF 50 kDa subunit [Thelohanellus kitauei]|uniref:U2 snRNP auxiliary factor large subunit n=1 Tax=Thelohanellus kitauei TaxID=669202 RepID=A0A0C2IKW2_THEKT|nr:Splicing factor U2AF 50 kDa subunit [Thelohanellus kitauei]
MAIPQGSTIILRARRLYIENLPEGTDPDEFVEFINTEMKNRNIGIKPGDPALSLDMGHDGETAYLEFRTSEECDAALALDGVEFKGKSVKIVRPNDYQPHNGYYFGCPHVFQDTLNKLFVACIPVHLTDDQVRELLTAFGELKAFNLVKDGASGLSKGYAFCEYRDGTVTDIAISGLNGMQISDKKLVVQRAVLGSRAGTNLGGIIPSVMQVPGVDPDHIISHDLLVTEVLCLINCLTDKDLEDDREYEDILEDVRQECSKYGEVLSVQIPRTDPNNPEITFEHVGKIFVEFGDKENCKEAHESLAGRKFNDRMVLTTFYDLDKYKRGEL